VSATPPAGDDDGGAPASPATGAEPTSTAIETVFETLLADIVRGTYPAGVRLPAERELSRQLGASRPTLREALRRLGEWNLVEPRRGSGVMVRHMREWSIEVMPAYLRYARPSAGQPSVARLLLDMMYLRRMLVTDIVRQLAPRARPGSMLAARAAAARAWNNRADARKYARDDLDVMRGVAEGAGFYPAMWLLNRIATVYVDVADSTLSAITPPADYVDVYGRFFDALEAGQTDEACALIHGFMSRVDAAMEQVLERMA
jgi:GntR family transcriptional repressor for pyruvate dehydrogenase complex